MVAIDFGLLHDRKSYAIIELTEFLNGVVRARVLVAELIAGEAEDEEVVGIFGCDALVELFQAFKLGCEAAF